ncbi:MAG: phosphate ABC transporter permease PstA [Yersiniaceae bacterium]|uniref:Phosphate transport system permease protein PstA n=1 Tax=Chimaeribacter coloradensis TaxID=2060068 RepID=A0A2N5DVF3_9GAMM|nr:phosphate ABC transporter permease PstA [Chimaeribacter coloradensis]MDU6410471.1 phosphate ABC transporter permease PstA [Yersiniaceae bacterium]PLR31015.1 phosphate ABC transporter, permease protein PstA [Chimaeribacter coloradensis]
MTHWRRAGTPWIWLTAAAVAVSVLALAGIILLLAGQGVRSFWPATVYQFTLRAPLAGQSQLLGELYARPSVPQQQLREAGVPLPPDAPAALTRLLVKVGNRDLAPGPESAREFVLLAESDVQSRRAPPEVLVLDREESGLAYGTLAGMLENGQPLVARNLAAELLRRIPENRALAARAQHLQHHALAHVNHRFEALRLEERRLAMNGQLTPRAVSRLHAERIEVEYQFSRLTHELEGLNQARQRDALLLRDAAGQIHTLPLSGVHNAWYPNAMSLPQKFMHTLRAGWAFLSENPRASNTAGGIFPALFGTVLMVVLMSVMVMPLGVIAAVYLHEYAGRHWLTRLLRIAVVNLAGVPSIVYGVFGLGFFVYVIGGSLDQLLFPQALPDPTFGTPGVLWAALTLALLTLPVVIVATEEGLSRIPVALRQGSLALGATQAQTLWRIVLPMAVPAMLTGMILAIARAAGETAPLMLVGVVKSVPALPVDSIFPYLHLDRKFMHLGFQIYDMALQSPNVEAAQPLVYATALLLVVMVVGLNLAAMGLRHSLREKFRSLGI